MPTTENYLEAVFANLVRRMGGVTEKLAPVRRGVPDRLVLLPGGRVELVELKTLSGSLSALQSLWHERAALLGTQVTVLRGQAAIEEWARQRNQELTQLIQHEVDEAERAQRRAHRADLEARRAAKQEAARRDEA